MSTMCITQAQPGDTGSAPQALLMGTAVNQDGRSSSLTAPNGPAQQAVITAALAANGTHASQVAMLQMHGTGTPLGDPIEVGAATAVLQAAPARTGVERLPAMLAASKSSCGHQEPAAGELVHDYALSMFGSDQNECMKNAPNGAWCVSRLGWA